jgi:hypothetical protein
LRFRYRNIFLAAILYIIGFAAPVMTALDQGSGPASLIAVIATGYILICMLLTRRMIAEAWSRQTANTIEFYRDSPAAALGQQWGSFQHVFASERPVTDALAKNLSASLRQTLGCSELSAVTMLDKDDELASPEKREFYKSTMAPTARKTIITLLCTFTKRVNVQGIRWWILVLGQRNPNALFWRYALSPIQIPFVIWPYLKRRFRPEEGLTTIYPGFFNSVDALTRAKELQFVAFQTLVDTLDSFNIDTSDLKQQRGNVLNIAVSGGQASFGTLIQGTTNKVTGSKEG